MKKTIIAISFALIYLFFLRGEALAGPDCTATTSCNGCGKNYIGTDTTDCHCACRGRKGECVFPPPPKCHAECDVDRVGCPIGTVTAFCDDCGGGGDDTLPTPTACPNPPPPALSSPANGSTFVLPAAPAQLFVDQVITGISQSCGPNAPEYNITFGLMGATWEKGWNSSLTYHTGPYGRTGTVSWKAKSRYLDSAYSIYRESIWTNPWTYQIVSPTPIPTATPAKTCDAAVTRWDPCYNSTRTDGSCQDANIRLRGQIINYGNSTSNISYRVTDYNGTVIYGGESRSLVPNQVWDINHTELPPDEFGNYPDFGVIYCGGLKLNVFCTDKPDANPNNNEGKKASPIRACQIIPPTPTPTQIPVSGWFQTQEGDVHAGKIISSKIPATTIYFSLGGPVLAEGVVSYGGSQKPDFGVGHVSQRGWLVNGSNQKKNFIYFKTLLGPAEPYADGREDIPGNTGVYYANRDVAFTSGGSIGEGKRIVLLVEGKVTIETNTEIGLPRADHPDRGSSLVVVSSEDIIVASSVTNLEGIFVADGIIDSGAGDQQLVVEGAFISSGSVSFGRDLGSVANKTTPGEKFINRPDFFINSHPLLWKSSFASWQELVP